MATVALPRRDERGHILRALRTGYRGIQAAAKINRLRSVKISLGIAQNRILQRARAIGSRVQMDGGIRVSLRFQRIVHRAGHIKPALAFSAGGVTVHAILPHIMALAESMRTDIRFIFPLILLLAGLNQKKGQPGTQCIQE